MDLSNALGWHRGRTYEDTTGAGDAGRPNKRLRTSKSHASILQPVTRLVRSPLETIGSIAESLGYGSEPVPPDTLTEEERDIRLELLRLRGAKTYDEWQAAATKLDGLEGGDEWKEKEECDEYDVELVKTRLVRLEKALERRDINEMRYIIRRSLTRDLGGLGNVSLYKHSRTDTKALVERYIAAVVDAIEEVADSACEAGDSKRAADIWEGLKHARQAFGRSALLLSGGGTLGMNHIGVIKALWEQGLLPRIVSGASAGSIVCAVLCTKTDAEIPDVLHDFCTGELDVFESEKQPQSMLDRAKRFLTTGAIYDISNLKRVMENMLGTMTFLESYNRTRRILNICVSNAGVYEMPRLLNYITAPHVTIASAVAASCSVPFVFTAADLFAKDPETNEIRLWDDSTSKWIDGSVDNDLPMTRLAEMLNVNHFIVSQVNPHVVPFLAKEEDEITADVPRSTSVLAPGPSRMQTIANLAKVEALHRMHILAELGVAPNYMTKVRSILGQRYSGDITIMPEVSYTQFPHILTNPTEEFMVQAMYNGERATWPKMSRIRNHLVIEIKLDWAVYRSLENLSFSKSQADLRKNAFSRTASTDHVERGRRRSSRGSHKTTSSTIVPRQKLGREAAHRPIHSMVEPPLPTLQVPVFADPTPPEYVSSTDEGRSPGSQTPVTDEDDSSDVQSDTSVSPTASPRLELWPSTRQLFPSASQPATPSMASKTFVSDSPGSAGVPTPRPTGLTMTPKQDTPKRPSSPELRYKKLFHGRLSPLPTIRSQVGTPEPRDEDQEQQSSQGRPGLWKRRSKLNLSLANLDISGTRGIMRRKKRSLSTGMPRLKPPDRQ